MRKTYSDVAGNGARRIRAVQVSVSHRPDVSDDAGATQRRGQGRGVSQGHDPRPTACARVDPRAFVGFAATGRQPGPEYKVVPLSWRTGETGVRV